VIGGVFQLHQRCGRVDVPEHAQGARGRVRHDLIEQQIIRIADARGFDDDVRRCRLCRNLRHTLRCCIIHHNLCPVGRCDVTVRLPVEGVGFVKGDVIAERRQRLEDAPVIGGRPVPVGRQKA
jgi:hypothetical protein